MKNNKGFTLVEILAAVVILGIIILISSNMVLKQVRKSKIKAFTTDVQQYIKSTDYDTLVKDKIDQLAIYSFPDTGIDLISKKKITIEENGEKKKVDAESGFMVKNEDDKIRIQVWHRGLNKCAVKNFNESEVKISDSIESEEDCSAFLDNLTNAEVSVKDLTGENVDYKLKASCYTLDENHNITNFDTTECGTVFIVPNKINGEHVAGISDSFVTNAPKNFSSAYIIGVKNITELPLYFLSENSSLTKVVLSLLPNLETIKAHLAQNSLNIRTFYLSKCPKLTEIASEVPGFVGDFGILSSASTNLENLTLEELPKLQRIYNSFEKTGAKKINISNLDSLTLISNGSFSYTDGDTEVTVSNNKNLTKLTNGFLCESNLKKLHIFGNDKLQLITDGALMGGSNYKNYIDELLIYNNPDLETIQNSAFAGYEFKTIKIYNNPKLKNIQYGAFSGIKAEVVDLSGVDLDEFNFSAFGGASIDKLIIPSSITSVSYGTFANFNSIVKDKIEFSGDNACSLMNYFRTDNGDGTYTYLVDKDKLPSCP